MYSYVTSSCNLVATFRGIVSHFVQTGYVFFVPIQLMTLNIAHEYVKIIIYVFHFFIFIIIIYSLFVFIFIIIVIKSISFLF